MQTGKGISIPSILKVGKGALTKIGSYLKNEGIEQAVIFFGNGLIDMFGTDVMNSLKQEDIKVLEYSELDTVDIDESLHWRLQCQIRHRRSFPSVVERSLMRENMRHFYAIFHLSVCRLPVRVMDFPVRVHPFLSTESALRFQHGLLTALLWTHRS